MKWTTLGALALASMTLSSMSVWALTEAPAETTDPGQSAVAKLPAAAAAASPIAVAGTPEAATFTAGKTIMVQGRLGHAVLAADRGSESFLFLDLATDAAAAPGSAAPVNLAIAIDNSGSMRGRRLANALAAARGMIGRLRDGDTVSVVAYDTAARVVLQPTTLGSGSSRQAAMDALSLGLDARGNTCISCGLEQAMSLLARRTGAVNRIMLLSDGNANRGVRDVEGFRRIAGRALGMETTITSIGVDVDYNERMMLAVARSSNGRHYFVENPSGLPRIFDAELQSLVQTVAADAQVEVELADGVEVAQVFDRGFSQDGNRLRVPMGAFAVGDRKSLLVRLRMDAAPSGSRPVADVRLRYRDLVDGEAGSCEGRLVAALTDDAAKVSELDPVVEARLGRAEANVVLAQANALLREGDANGARGVIARGRGRLTKRRRSASTRAPEPAAAAVAESFDAPTAALDFAAESFEEAIQAAPVAPQRSRAGKRSLKKNSDNESLLGL